MSNEETTDAEHEASECLRRIADNDKRIGELKSDIKERPDSRQVEISEHRQTNKGLLMRAKSLAREGGQMIARSLDQ